MGEALPRGTETAPELEVNRPTLHVENEADRSACDGTQPKYML
jgi:hypothetical protein